MTRSSINPDQAEFSGVHAPTRICWLPPPSRPWSVTGFDITLDVKGSVGHCPRDTKLAVSPPLSPQPRAGGTTGKMSRGDEGGLANTPSLPGVVRVLEGVYSIRRVHDKLGATSGTLALAGSGASG